jgi:O-antigen ligase
MLFTGSRTAWFAFVISLSILVFFLAFLQKRWKLPIIFLLLMILVLPLIYKNRFVQERIKLIFSDVRSYQQGIKTTSIGLRFEMWKASIYIIKNSPFFGAGTGDYKVEVKKLIKKERCILV